MAQPYASSERFCFGPFETDVHTRELRKYGLRIPLQEKSFAVLAALLEHPGDLVTREELYRRLWPEGVHVDFEDSLNTAVNRLRDVLRDNARRPRYIETLHDRGYRFIAPVSSAVASVAVLPFADLSRDQDQEYFCEGMAEEISNALSRIKLVRVASPIGAFQFRSGGDPHTIGRRLLVGTLVEGSVRRSGSRLRIEARLTDVETGYQLWSGTFDRDMTDIFAIQDEIGCEVAQALELELTAEERQALNRAPTADLRAYDDYLRGRKFYYLYTRRDVEFAIQLFSHAAELDPGYVMAHAGLADCWSWLYLYSRRSESDRENANASSLRAVRLDPCSAQAQASRALALSLDRRNAGVEAAFETAVRLDPRLFEAQYFYARYAFATGRLEKAAALFERAIEVRPEYYIPLLLVAQIYDELGRSADARDSRQRGVQLAQRHLEHGPDDARALYFAANGLVGLGERERGLEYAERALSTMPDEPIVLYNLGCIYSMLGRVAEAMDCLKRAAAVGLADRGFFEHDSNLDPIREEPAFQTLIASL